MQWAWRRLIPTFFNRCKIGPTMGPPGGIQNEKSRGFRGFSSIVLVPRAGTFVGLLNDAVKWQNDAETQ